MSRKSKTALFLAAMLCLSGCATSAGIEPPPCPRPDGRVADELEGLSETAAPNFWTWMGRQQLQCDAIDRMRTGKGAL
jgi:hypothetical protein